MNDNGDNGNGKRDPGGGPPKAIPEWVLWIAGAIFILFLLWGCNAMLGGDTSNEIEPAQFEQLMDKKLIGRDSIVWVQSEQGVIVSGIDTSTQTKVKAKASINDPLVERLEKERIPPEVGEGGESFIGLLFSFLPMLIFFGFMFYLMRSLHGGGAGGGLNNFSRSRARQKMGSVPKVRFSDVAGVEEAKIQLQELVEFLKNPIKFQQIGARAPRGALMVGPPGTGKTLCARAIAGEANVPFFSISGSEFVEMFVGVGASRVRDLFDQAKRNAPSIIFIDEIDAVGRHRGAGLGGGHDEREQTLNQILVEMDGFDVATSILVIAATNRPDILDPAILRPGRFDRRVVLNLPDIEGRKKILAVHARGKPFEEGLSWERVAQETVGFSGADLANLLNESAILAARRDKKEIGFEEISESVDTVQMGPENKSRVIPKDERRIVAYHEAGHAVCEWANEHGDPLRKVSIIGRGSAGGYTKSLPETDRTLYTIDYLKDRIVMALGGRLAEALFCGSITTGASNDLKQLTAIARAMVTQYGMSDELGNRTFGQKQEMVFLGREISEHQDYSDDTARRIDEEVSAIIKDAETRARKVLESYKDKVESLVSALLKRETLEADDLVKILGPKPKTA